MACNAKNKNDALVQIIAAAPASTIRGSVILQRTALLVRSRRGRIWLLIWLRVLFTLL